MKTSLTSLVLLAFASHVIADVPKKIPKSRYSSLWQNSPFTSKPVIDDPIAPENELNDYVLIGVSSLGGTKYRVTLMNKKNPEDERKYVESDVMRPPDNFKILKVNRTPGDPLGTTVELSSGNLRATLGYDEKLLTIAAVAKPPVPPNNAGQPPNPNTPNVPPNPNAGRPGGPPNANTPPGIKPPRPRVIAPPAPQPGAPSSANPQPAVQGEGGRDSSNGGGQRPSRRRSY